MQALRWRFTRWEKEVADLSDFLQIQRFQRNIARHYITLSDIAVERFSDEILAIEGVATIWRSLRDQTSPLTGFIMR